MDKKPKIWKEAYQEARKRVRKQLGTKGEAVKLAVVIIGTALTAGALSVFGLMKIFGVNYTVPEIVWYLLGGQIVFVFMLLISEPVVAVFRMFGIVNELFLRLLSTQEKVVYHLTSKEANLLTTQAINQKDWVGIRVINNEKRYIEGVIRIESIRESKNFSDSLELKRHSIANTDTFKLTYKAHGDFDLVVLHGQRALIPHHGGMHYFELLPGKYHLETHLIAEFRDAPQGLINPKIEYWRLVYSLNTKPVLQLTKISDVASQIRMKDEQNQ